VVKAVKSAQLGKRLFSFFVLSTRYWSSTATSILRLSEELACHYSEKGVSHFPRTKYYNDRQEKSSNKGKQTNEKITSNIEHPHIIVTDNGNPGDTVHKNTVQWKILNETPTYFVAGKYINSFMVGCFRKHLLYNYKS
jgi:hypothetical protein